MQGSIRIQGSGQAGLGRVTGHRSGLPIGGDALTMPSSRQIKIITQLPEMQALLQEGIRAVISELIDNPAAG